MNTNRHSEKGLEEVRRKLKRMEGFGPPVTEGLAPDDRGHIELLCRRHNFYLLNKMQGIYMAVQMASDFNSLLNCLNASYSTRSHNEVTGKDSMIMMYLNSENFSTPEEGYFVALHEIGHQVLRHGPNEETDIETHIRYEIEAWEWALAHANRFPNDDTIMYIIDVLSTYTDPEHTLKTIDDRESKLYMLQLAEEAAELALQYKAMQMEEEMLKQIQERKEKK